MNIFSKSVCRLHFNNVHQIKSFCTRPSLLAAAVASKCPSSSNLLQSHFYSANKCMINVDAQPLTHHLLHNTKGLHTLSSPSSLYSSASNQYCGLIQPTSSRILSNIESTFFFQPSKSVTMFNRKNGYKRTVKMIVKRFRRLGNGMWIRKQAGYKKKVWRQIMQARGTKKWYKAQRILICNEKQSKMLDKMVTDYWKRQKWYVEDPYEGYTKETLFYYHPKDLPGNSVDLPEDYYKYAIHRYKLGNMMRKQRSRNGRRHQIRHRQMPIPNAKYGFVFC